MTTYDITIRWAGASDATASSSYRIERSLDGNTFSLLAASQAATTPYAVVATTLSADAAFGATTVDLTSGTSVPTAGFGYVDGEALLEWTGKSSNQLTGCIWHSGYGIYASGSAFLVAHESYTDSAVTNTYEAVVYRLTHLLAGQESAPAYLWYWIPPRPVTSNHCVVIVAIDRDIWAPWATTVDRRVGVTVQAYLTTDVQFEKSTGAHLDANTDSDPSAYYNAAYTNALGLACFQLPRSSALLTAAGQSASTWTFVLGAENAASRTFTVTTIPDRDWILLSQLVG